MAVTAEVPTSQSVEQIKTTWKQRRNSNLVTAVVVAIGLNMVLLNFSAHPLVEGYKAYVEEAK